MGVMSFLPTLVILLISCVVGWEGWQERVLVTWMDSQPTCFDAKTEKKKENSFQFLVNNSTYLYSDK